VCVCVRVCVCVCVRVCVCVCVCVFSSQIKEPLLVILGVQEKVLYTKLNFADVN